MTREHIVVVGGGYAGTVAAIRLAGRARRRARVTLVNPAGAFVQRLRLHQIAAGQRIAAPPLARLAGRRVDVVEAAATGLHLDSGHVEAGGERIGFDRLVLATGSTIDRSVPGAAEHAHALDGLPAALALRDALRALADGASVAVVGGGMTGLEAATELAEAHPRLRVRLVTAGALGGWLSEAGRAYLPRALGRLGVEVVEHARVGALEPGRALLAGGATVPFALAVWCGGFAPRPLAREAGLAVDARGGVLVDPALRSLSHPHVLAVGDAAAAGVRMTCQAGMPLGAHAADTVAAELTGRDPEPFAFGYLHQPISLGRRDALIQWVDRADRPKRSVLTGRRAAVYKNVVTSFGVTALRLERRFPGSMRWLGPGGAPAMEPLAA